MNFDMFDILICPVCKGNLKSISFNNNYVGEKSLITTAEKEVVYGVLKCQCECVYPVIEGVPRLLDDGINLFPEFINKYRKQLERVGFGESLKNISTETNESDDYDNIRNSFSREWGLFDYDGDKTWGWTLDERKQVFLEDIKMKSEELAGKYMLDAGCGNGTLTAVLGNFGLRIIGMDLNDGLGLAYHNLSKFAKGFENNIDYVQGNLLNPPIKNGLFDIIYSSGVIHHTPNSKAVFEKLVPLIKREGRLYIWVYGKRGLLVRMFFGAGRALKRFITLRSLVQFCRLLAPFYKVVAETLKFLGIMDFRSRTTKEITLDLFDAFAPRYNHWHTKVEVRSWFQEFGFKNINVSGKQKHGFGMYGDLI